MMILSQTPHQALRSCCTTSQRYKFLKEFAIYPCGCDILLRNAICPFGTWNLYHIATERSEVISHFAEQSILLFIERKVYRKKERFWNKYIAKEKKQKENKTIKKLAVELTVEIRAICDNCKKQKGISK